MNYIRKQVVKRVIAERVGFVVLALVVVASAVATKRSSITAPLAEIDLGPSSALASIAPTFERSSALNAFSILRASPAPEWE